MIEAIRESLMAPLNARELAFAIWAPIVASISALFPKIRYWTGRKIAALGDVQTLRWWLGVLVFSVGVIWGLALLGLWSVTLFRPTLLWLLLVPGAVALGLTNRGERRYASVVAVSLVVFEVLFGIQPLPLWLEISLWPLYGVAAIVSGVALGYGRTTLGHGIHVFIILVTLSILAYSVWALIANWNQLDKLLLMFPVFMATVLLGIQWLGVRLKLLESHRDSPA